VVEDNGGGVFFHCDVLRFVQTVNHSEFRVTYGLYKP